MVHARRLLARIHGNLVAAHISPLAAVDVLQHLLDHVVLVALVRVAVVD